MAPGAQGSPEGCRVDLLFYVDTSYRVVGSGVSGPPDRFGRSHYELTGLVEGARFLRAWQDRDGDSAISDSDLVGVRNGRFRRGFCGEPFWVGEGLSELGPVELARFDELEFTTGGRRLAGDSMTEFTYSFNHDVDLTALLVTFPLYGSYLDASGPGRKRADSVYLSTGWRLTTGPMPTGEHLLRFRGSGLDTLFDTTLTVRVD
jgi:hypothetical protein